MGTKTVAKTGAKITKPMDVTGKTESSVKIEARSGKPPVVTVHVYAQDPEEAAELAVDLWFQTQQTVIERYAEEMKDG